MWGFAIFRFRSHCRFDEADGRRFPGANRFSEAIALWSRTPFESYMMEIDEGPAGWPGSFAKRGWSRTAPKRYSSERSPWRKFMNGGQVELKFCRLCQCRNFKIGPSQASNPPNLQYCSASRNLGFGRAHIRFPALNAGNRPTLPASVGAISEGKKRALSLFDAIDSQRLRSRRNSPWCGNLQELILAVVERHIRGHAHRKSRGTR